jgi:hypothetical protein
LKYTIKLLILKIIKNEKMLFGLIATVMFGFVGNAQKMSDSAKKQV